MIEQFAAFRNPPELKVAGSTPAGHAIFLLTFSNNFTPIARANARSLAQFKLRPISSVCAGMTRVLSKVCRKFLMTHSCARGVGNA